MRWSDIGDAHCSIARTLSVVGDRWTILLLREAFMRTRRFEDFQANTGASRAIVADRLKQLVADGVLERVRYQAHPERFEYRLTPKGRDLYPVMTALMAWGDRWMPVEGGPPVTLTHDCGRPMLPELSCPHCHGTVTPERVRASVSAAGRGSVEGERDGLAVEREQAGDLQHEP